MRSIFLKLIIRARRTTWALIVAYMLGIHNFYKGEDKAPEDIVKITYTIEHNEVLEDGTPRD